MEWIRLGDITEILDYRRVPLNNEERSKISNLKLYPYCGANGIIDYIDEFIFDEDEEIICVAEDGGAWGYLQKCSYIMKEKCWVNNHAHVLKAKSNFNSKFLNHYLNYKDLSNHITGTTRGKLTQKEVKNILIPNFKLEKQNIIVNFLSRIETLIRNRKEQIQAYDDLIESLFFDMLQYELMSDKIEYSKLGDLTSHISSGSTPRGGSSVYKSEGIPLIRSQDVKMNNLDYSNVVYIDTETHDKMKRSKLKNRDVLLNITGASIGRTAVFYGEDDPANTNQHVVAIRLKDEKVSPEFLSFYFSTEYFQAIIKNISSGGTREALNYKQIREFDIPSISKIKQEKFIKNKEKIEEEKKKLNSSLKELGDLFDALMQDAFSGNLFKD